MDIASIDPVQRGKRSWKRRGEKPMNPQTTAIVLIEYQNDFTTVGGFFHDGVKDVMQSNNMLANTVEVANKGRAAGATVMHAPISFAEGYGDAFPSTNLDFILRSKGIQTVVLAGFLTNCCVESTMRSAYERGFDVVTLKDCTATLSQEAQNMALTHNFGMFSRPMNHDEFLKLLA